jgi:polyferredoxin
LSVVNILAFTRNLGGNFTWDTLLIEPVIFMLWAFVAISILLWGRGVYCGWLCPFGAAQDLLSKLANRFGFEGYRLPQRVHERLWAIKYFILIALVGLSLDSMVNAARLAEVEPFKTVFIMRFAREPQYVIYALALLAVTTINSKFYCKYLCPLGAALSFVTRFRIFDWLRRRRECGAPCQTCARQCQVAAIKPTGEIIDNECHYCLECQVTYSDDHRCPPLVDKRKKREARERKARDIIAAKS